jgi:hypothetical protein
MDPDMANEIIALSYAIDISLAGTRLQDPIKLDFWPTKIVKL